MRVHTAPADESVSELMEIVRNSGQPVTLAKLKTKNSNKKLAKELLEQLADEKQIYRWPKGKSAAYWHAPAEDYAAQKMLALAGERAMARPDLAKAAARQCFGRLSATSCRSLVRDLLQSGQLTEMPGPGGLRNKVVFLKDRPAAYLQMLAEYVAPYLKMIEEQGCRREQFLDIVRGSLNHDPKRHAEQIYRALRQLQNAFDAHILVRQLRQHPELAELSKEDFDSAVLQLANDRRVQLSRHDDVFHLTPELRQELVFEPPDKYYVAIAARD